MLKSGLKFILKFTEPLQRYLLTCQANSALMGRFFGTARIVILSIAMVADYSFELNSIET